jgi:hypothetical protein
MMQEKKDITDALIAFDGWFTSGVFTKGIDPEQFTENVKHQMFVIFLAGWTARDEKLSSED